MHCRENVELALYCVYLWHAHLVPVLLDLSNLRQWYVMILKMLCKDTADLLKGERRKEEKKLEQKYFFAEKNRRGKDFFSRRKNSDGL